MATILVAKLILKEQFLTKAKILLEVWDFFFVIRYLHPPSKVFHFLLGLFCVKAKSLVRYLGEWVGAQSPPNAPPFILPTFAAVIIKVTVTHLPTI